MNGLPPWTYRLTAAGLLLMLTGCASLRPNHEKVDQTVLPGAFQNASGEQAVTSHWWEDLKNDELNALIKIALAGNLNLAQIYTRLQQAEATAVGAGAGRVPTVDLTTGSGWTRSVTRLNRDSGNPTGRRVATKARSFSLGFAASYEVDLWGRVRDGRMAASEDVYVARAATEAAAMSLTAEVTSHWIRLIEEGKQLDLLKSQLKVNKATLKNIEGRLRKGQGSALDVYQQKQTVAQVEARLPLTETNLALIRHSLNLLLGRPATSPLPLKTKALPILPAFPTPGLPSQLLENRPDVRSALHALNAADWRVAAARADRFPALRLSGSYTHQNSDLNRLYDNWALNLAESLTAPLIDGGRKASTVAKTRALAREKGYAYTEAILNAVKEVEDAAVQEKKYRVYLEALRTELRASRKAYTTAWENYRQGQSTYLSTQVALIAVQQHERDELQVCRELIGYRVSLYRALGGTWTKTLLKDYPIGRPRAEVLTK